MGMRDCATRHWCVLRGKTTRKLKQLASVDVELRTEQDQLVLCSAELFVLPGAAEDLLWLQSLFPNLKPALAALAEERHSVAKEIPSVEGDYLLIDEGADDVAFVGKRKKVAKVAQKIGDVDEI